MDRIRQEDLPLYPEDLAICQRVFDALRQDCGIAHDQAMCDLLAWHVISCYRCGVRDEVQLGHLARSMIKDGAPRSLLLGVGKEASP